MSKSSRPQSSLLGTAGILVLAVALGLGTLAVGEKAVLGVLGAIGLVVFISYPAAGLYLTTALLLLSGSSAILGGFGMTWTGAKLCGAATLLAWGINVLLGKEPFRMGRECWLVLAFLAWSLVGIANSAFWRDQLPEWIRLATLAAYFILAVNLLNSRKRIHGFVLVLAVCGMAMSLYAVAQYVMPSMQMGGAEGLKGVAAGAEGAYVDTEGLQSGAAVRVSGRAGHSNWLAMILLMILPLNAYWFAVSKTNRGKALAVCAVGIELTALIWTFTRLSFVVGVAVAVIMVTTRLVKLNPQRIAALVVALTLGWVLLPQQYKERVLDLGHYTETDSSRSRIILQQYAWKYTEDKPIAGEGIGGFGLKFQDERHNPVAGTLRILIEEFGWNPVYFGPHNMYLQLTSETGVVGLLLIAGLFVSVFRRLRRAGRAFRGTGDATNATLVGAMGVSLISFVFCAVFLHALQQKIWWMVLAVAVATALLSVQALPGKDNAAAETEEA
jgi:O-antigen ligase